MINRLPGWVWIGGGALAGIAGMVNAVGFLGLNHHGLTHMSGAASALGIDVAAGRGDGALYYAALIAAFVGGAVVSSIIVKDEHLQLGRRYGVALLAEAGLLVVSLFLLSRGIVSGAFVLAAAAGLQNAMVSTFSGAIVRTTHVTGVLTDIGIIIGHALRGMPLEKRKLKLLSAIAAGFILGSGIGAWQFDRIGYNTLWTPVAVTGLGGLGYIAFRHGKEVGD